MTSPTKKVLIPIVLIIILAVGALTLIKKQVASSRPAQGAAVAGEIRVGSQLPDFKLQEFQGKAISASNLQGKVTIMNFWATWCEACMSELPSLNKLRDHFSGKGVDVLLLNVDETPEKVLPPVIKQLGISAPIYLDQGGTLSDLFDVHAIPFTVIFDKNRKVLYMESGERDWDDEDIHAQLDKWLSEK